MRERQRQKVDSQVKPRLGQNFTSLSVVSATNRCSHSCILYICGFVLTWKDGKTERERPATVLIRPMTCKIEGAKRLFSSLTYVLSVNGANFVITAIDSRTESNRLIANGRHSGVNISVHASSWWNDRVVEQRYLEYSTVPVGGNMGNSLLNPFFAVIAREFAAKTLEG